tara:strand:+ start:698 stop:1126 length:429 start_codon:yes stop_codon:yes gene_type:complete
MKNKPNLPNLDLGFLTEKKVQSKLIENGFSTFDPLDEGGTVDLLSYKKNIFNRLQIKTGIYDSKTDRFKISLLRTRHQRYDYKDFEFIIGYLYEVDTFYVVPVSILKDQQVINVYPHRDRLFIKKGTIDYEMYKDKFYLLED